MYPRLVCFLAILFFASACHKLLEDDTRSETMGALVYAKIDVRISETSMDVLNDASSEMNSYHDRVSHEADMRTYCRFQVKKGTYSLTKTALGLRIQANDPDPANLFRDMELKGPLQGRVEAVKLSRSQALASNRDWKIEAGNPILKVNEDGTQIELEVTCRVFR